METPCHRTRWRRCLAGAALLCALLASPALSAAQGLAAIRITGLNEAQTDNVRLALSLSRLGAKQRAELSDARLAFLLRRAEREALAALEPFGLYHAQVDIAAEASDKGVIVRLAFTPGEPVRVAESRVEVHGPAGDETEFKKLIAAFEPRVGRPLVHSRYRASKSEIARTLVQRGYFDARIEQARVEVRRAERSAGIELAWDSGPRYRLGETRFEGSPLREGLLAPLAPWEPGALYHQDQLIDLQQRLIDLDYFAVVDVRPDHEPGDGPEGPPSGAEDNAETGPDPGADEAAPEDAAPEQTAGKDRAHSAPAVPIIVELTPARRNVYSAGVSFGTDSGAGVKLGYERRWLNRHGHKFRTELQASQRRRALVGQYRIPAFGHGPGWWGLRTGVRDEEFEGFDVTTAELVGDRTWRWGRWNMTAAYTVQRETIDDKRQRTAVPIIRRNTVAFPALTAQIRHSDDPVFTRRGWALTTSLRGGSDALLSDVNFLQWSAQARWIRPLADSTRLLLRGEVGSTRVDDILALPVGLRFFAGGDRSLRGYDLRTVGPRLDDAVIGGRHLLVGSAEVDHFFGGGNWGVAGFVDAGNAVNDLANYDPVVGAGLGLRWRSPVGPVRLDLAHGFDNPDESFRIHLTIGPDL